MANTIPHKLPLILNKNSGTVLRLGEEKIAELVETHMGDYIGSIHILSVQEIPNVLEKLAVEHPLGIAIGGGDGSAVCAAEQLAKHAVPFGILPLGTMNLLAQDLGAAPTFEETLQRFKGFKPDLIDCGIVNGKRFLCSAVIGFVPEGAVVREELRENVTIENMARFLTTIARGIGGTIKNDLDLRSRSTDAPFSLSTTSLIISNNGFIQKPGEAAQRFSRESLNNGRLAVYSASPRDMVDGLKMALSMWQGDWQDHESILSFELKELIVETKDRKILISLDGEPVEMKSPLHFSIAEKSVPVLRLELEA